MHKLGLFLFSLGIMESLYAETTALVAGSDVANNAYIGILIDGNPVDLTLEANTDLTTVSLSPTGNGIAGGVSFSGNVPSAYFIVGDTATPITLGFSGGSSTIKSVSIDSAGTTAIIGGIDNADPYAALVTDEGATVTPITLGVTGGEIAGVSINSSDIALIAGSDSSGAYAALIESGAPTSIDLGFSGGFLASCAINDSAVGIVGGQDGDGNFYAAITNGSTPTAVDFGVTMYQVEAVAINSSSVALVGGSGAHAYIINGTTPTQIDLAGGTIYSVAINDSSEGIIAGTNLLGNTFVGLVSPDGGVRDVTPSSVSVGSIPGVAINDAGVSLIGGFDNDGNNYSAFVSPSGAATQIPFEVTSGNINSVAIGLFSLNSTTPTSIGPYNSTINSQLAATYALESHILLHHKPDMWNQTQVKNNEVASADLLADATDRVVVASPKCNTAPYTIWVAPFYDYVNQSAQGSIPSLSNQIGGFIAALDYHKDRHVFGGGVGYAFNYAHYGQEVGHATINQEMLFLFESYQSGSFFINGTVWGGYYQVNNERHSGFGITSNGKPHGWQCTPHLEMSGFAYRNPTNWFILEPFGMFDWVNNWQNSYTESGAAGFNVVMPSIYSSLLRSEAGLRFYELLSYGWGQITLEEKLSYINQAPFGTQSASTFFVGSISTFSVVTGSTTVQNLGGFEFHCEFIPTNTKYPYGNLDFQGEFGSSYQSYFVGAEIGKRF